MRRIQKILSGIFLGGVLLGGIGTGVALVEYSSLVYAGERQLGEEYVVTRELDYVFSPETEEVTIVDSYWEENMDLIEMDETVPEGTIRYVIDYNEKAVKPSLVYWEADEEPDEEPQSRKNTQLQLRVRYISSDFAVLMTCKDEILTELKQKRIFDYDMVYIDDLKIKVNPQSMPFVHRQNN